MARSLCSRQEAGAANGSLRTDLLFFASLHSRHRRARHNSVMAQAVTGRRRTLWSAPAGKNEDPTSGGYRKSRHTWGAEGKAMTILQATKSKASSAVSRSSRLFLLELS